MTAGYTPVGESCRAICYTIQTTNKKKKKDKLFAYNQTQPEKGTNAGHDSTRKWYTVEQEQEQPGSIVT